MRQVADRAFDLGEIHGERAVGIGYKGALIGQVVELQRHAFAVRFGEAEAKRAECRGEKRGVELALRIGPCCIP